MKENRLNDKKIIVAYFGLTVLALLTWFAFYQMSQSHNNPEGDVATNVVDDISLSRLEDILKEAGYSEEYIGNMSEEDKRQAVLSTQDYRYKTAANKQYSLATSASEYDESLSVEKYQEVLAMVKESNYGFAASQVEEILMRFNLTSETNMKLANIMSDAIIMDNYDNLDWEQKEMSLRSFKNPETFVLGVLKAYPRRREVVIWDKNSYSPVSTGEVYIKSSTLIGNESPEYAAAALYSEDVRNVYRIDFSFGEFSALYAYVLECHDRRLTMSGIYSNEQYEHLRTVAWWIERGQDREKGV